MLLNGNRNWNIPVYECLIRLNYHSHSLHGGYILSVFLTNIYCSFAYYMIVIALFVKYKQLYGYSCYRPLYFVKKTKPK